MAATPAWPPKSLVRLFLDGPLAQGAVIDLDRAQANYLGNVMRKGADDQVLLFDGQSGEWLARIIDAGRNRMSLSVVHRTRALEPVPDLVLAFAPLKRAQTDWLVEKATELGVARLQPVMTRRTISERVKIERLRSIAIEAAEQCGRTSLPAISQPISLASFLDGLGDRRLYFADEQGGTSTRSAFTAGPAAILVGPEGGFGDDERGTIRARSRTIAISLGPRILRAETAALAAIAAWMIVAGDWQ